MIRFNLQLFAMKGSLGYVKPDSDKEIKPKYEKKPSYKVPKRKTNTPTTEKVTVQAESTKPVPSPVKTQAEKDAERYYADKAASDELKKQGITDPTRVTYEERKRIQKEKQTSSKPTQTTTQQPVSEVDELAKLRAQMLEAEKKRLLSQSARLSESERKALADKERGIAPRIQAAKSDVSVTGQLGQKRLKDIFAATGAEEGTQTARQLGIEQGIQSGIGALTRQETEERAQIERDRADIATREAQRRADIEGQMTLQGTQMAYQELQAQRARQQQLADVASEREFTITRDQAKYANDRELLNAKAQIDQNLRNLDAQIQIARDNNNFANEQVLLQQKADINARQAAIDAELDARNIRLRGEQDRILQGMRSQSDLANIAARGEEDRRTLEYKGEQPGSQKPVIPTSAYTKNIDDQIRRYAGTLEFSNRSMTDAETKDIAIQTLLNIPDDQITDAQLAELMVRYNIQDSDLTPYLQNTSQSYPGMQGGLQWRQ